MFYDITF
ncbi:Protein CBG26904 [Caenorhabditis briggsae]|nr:Protein CBG26904 [Caenorhabditis briggsae]CAR98442.1 Protein CBG26904 [Caenorhabditis briggsae]